MKTKEIISLIIALIIIAFVALMNQAYLSESKEILLIDFLFALLFFAIILIVNVVAKKISAHIHNVDIEHKIWHFQRWGYYERSHFKKPIPVGIILPFILSILTFGAVPWYAVTQFDAKPQKHRAVRKHDVYSFAELTDRDLGLIAATGIWPMLLIVAVAYIINLPALGSLALFFAAFNLIPLGQLDGTKIFFGSHIRWIIYSAIVLALIAYSIILI
ncbi:MAG: hypothetical protein KKF56_00825 [Nanoarchaeota archaeon]|nr:hypothetical protein [Nanoarchaeota archaeon]